jgi:hypothetical protein
MACTDTKAQFQFECCTAFEGAGKVRVGHNVARAHLGHVVCGFSRSQLDLPVQGE